jgi:AmmeMemoRadiSam system protein A
MPTELATPALPEGAGGILLPLARAAIAAKVGVEHPASADAEWLRTTGACFVTLMREARLRGCIGTLRAARTLLEDVRHNAVAAAFHDPRFRPLTREEYLAISVEVSVLSPLTPLDVAGEAEALAQLRPGIDGLTFEFGHHRSTFLPQVWESYRQPAEFLGRLKIKAGLPPDFWDAEVKLSRYVVSKWREADEVMRNGLWER